jgi:hypothetical protein
LPGLVAHTYNPRYLGGVGSRFKATLGKKLARPHQSANWAWWCMSVILATQEDCSPGKNKRFYLKNN